MGINFDAALSFRNATALKRENTEVTFEDGGQVLKLHGNAIVRKRDGRIEITDAGQPTALTKHRLNGVLDVYNYPYRIRLTAGKLFMGNDDVSKMLNGWITLTELREYLARQEADTIEAIVRTATEIPELPKAPPEPKPEPKPKPRTEAEIELSLEIEIKRKTESEAIIGFSEVLDIPLASANLLFQAYRDDLTQLMRAKPAEIAKLRIPKIGHRKAEKIAGVFEIAKMVATATGDKEKITSPSDVADFMMGKMRHLDKEVVAVLALDTKGNITRQGQLTDNWGNCVLKEAAPIFEGTLNASVFHPREILRFAINAAANSIVLVHNHPSGDPQPSQEDIRATKQLIEAGNCIGIKVLDHIVIGDGIFVSLKEEGHI